MGIFSKSQYLNTLVHIHVYNVLKLFKIHKISFLLLAAFKSLSVIKSLTNPPIRPAYSDQRSFQTC